MADYNWIKNNPFLNLKVGDQQEARAIYNAYCLKPGRVEPLPIGLLKSNIGHSEGASGASSVAKVLLAYENECVAPNLHPKKLKAGIAEMSPMLSPIMECLPYTPGIIPMLKFLYFNLYFILSQESLESTISVSEE